jgi:hypothetical protein
MHLQDALTKTTPAGDDSAARSAEQPSQQFVAGEGGQTLRSARRIIFGKGNLLLACLFAAGIGCVYLLRLSGGPQTASAQQQINESQVNAVLTAMGAPNGAKGASAATVVAAFYTQASQRQLPLAALGSNPFIYQPSQAKVMTPATTKPAISDEASAKNTAQALESQMQAARTLTLQSVLTGAAGATAVISNNLLTEGQTIRGWTISKIGFKEVVLTWKDQTFVLKMR